MGTSKREEFPLKTKRLAAEKVAYFCSNPKCRRFTIGPTDDGKSHSYGEAAHIYAASIYGPRGNSLLTINEIKSESNCLWLCNNCHELIDANPRLYSPELLKEWKKNAEGRAFEFVSNQNRAKELIDDIERSSGLASYFDELFYRGDFKKVIIAIYELSKKDNLDENYREELCFAQTRYDAYCARANLLENLKWIKSASQSIKERLVDFAIECYDETLCNQVKLLSDNASKRELSSMIGEGTNFEDIIKWIGTNSKGIENKSIVNSSSVIGGVKSEKALINDKNERISFRGSWLLDTYDTISDFLYDTLMKKDIDEKRLQLLLDKIDIFTWLDDYYISSIIDNNFKFFPRGKLLEKLLLTLIEKGVSTPELRVNYFFGALPKEKRESSMDKAIELGLKYDDNRLISYALTIILINNPEKVVSFIENNIDLLNIDLLFFEPYRSAKERLNQPFNVISYLKNDYIGKKSITYYLIFAHEYLLLNGENDSFANYWRIYKDNDIDYDDEYIFMALEIAFKTNDEDFIRNVCLNTTNVGALLFIAENAIQKDISMDIVLTISNRLKSVIGNFPNNYNRIMFFLHVKTQKYNEAISYGKKAYYDEGDKKLAAYIIQLLIDLAIFEEDDFIHDVSRNSIEPYSLNVLGQFYIKSNKIREGYDYIARSVSLLNDTKNLSFLAPFIECELLDVKKESDNYTYVTTESNNSFLILPSSERIFFGDSIFGTKIFYSDDRSDLCFLSKGSRIVLNDEECIIKEIYDYFYYFHAIAMERLVNNPSTIAFKGDNVEDAINQITEIVKKAEKEQEEFLKSTNGQPLPFFLFEKSFGRGICAAVEALYFSKARRSFFVPVSKSSQEIIDISDGFLFDIEMVYLAYRLGLSNETIKNDKCKITSLTKGALLNEIALKENDYRSSREKGSLTTDSSGNRTVYIERNQEKRRYALVELHRLKQLVNSFMVVTPDLEKPSKEQSEVLGLFNKEKDNVDAEVIKALWSGSVIVSNNLMLHMGKALGKGNIIDLSRYLSLSFCSAIETIKVVKNMWKTNINQYLTPDVFNSIINKLSVIKNNDEKNKATKEMVELIKGNWDNDWTNEEIEKHKAIVYLASVDERDNINKTDDIHVAINAIFEEMLMKYISHINFKISFK